MSTSASTTTEAFDWLSIVKDDNERKAIESLRSKLESIENDSVRELAQSLHVGDLMRFVRARELNVDKALLLLQEACEWRLKVKPDQLSTEADPGLAGCESLQTLWLSDALDTSNRPILYMKPGGTNPHSVEKRVLFLVLQLERAVQRMAPPVTQFTWVCDFSGYGQRARSSGGMQVARDSLHVLQTAYCERLGAMFIVNSPFFFSMLYTCMSPFMSARTKAKIRWISGNEAAIRAQMAEIVTDPDRRLFEEENKDEKK